MLEQLIHEEYESVSMTRLELTMRNVHPYAEAEVWPDGMDRLNRE